MHAFMAFLQAFWPMLGLASRGGDACQTRPAIDQPRGCKLGTFPGRAPCVDLLLVQGPPTC